MFEDALEGHLVAHGGGVVLPEVLDLLVYGRVPTGQARLDMAYPTPEDPNWV